MLCTEWRSESCHDTSENCRRLGTWQVTTVNGRLATGSYIACPSTSPSSARVNLKRLLLVGPRHAGATGRQT